MDSSSLLHIATPLKLKGDLSSSLSIQLSTSYGGKIKTKKNLHCDPHAELQGGIRSQTLQIDPGSKIHADVQIGTRIPLWISTLFFRKHPTSDE